MTHVVVIGAGQAGAALVAKLRGAGHTGQITLIGEETAPPYQRPPLSKAYLLGEMEEERLWLRGPDFYAEHDITLRLGQRVSAIDPAAKTVTVGGEVIAYDELALTTGSTPRRLPAAVGGDLAGVYTVRTLADVDAMKAEFVAGRRLVIVGGGYIGLEAAAVASKLGLDVTVLEMAPRILQRVAAPETSDYFRALHTAHGVKILESTGLDRLLGDTRVTGARLTDGTELPADFVIAGVGIIAGTALAEAAGLEIENGIKTDEQGRTSDPHIWSAGDCASFPWKGGRLRLESVGNAIDQAETVAENILGAGKAYDAKPWFWSDQYDCKLQIAGLNTGYDNIVTRGPEGESVSFWYFKGDTLLAVDAVNDPRAYMVGKRLIEQGKSPAKAALTNPATVMKDLLKA
ncbi:MAG: pyridine nucleotide-disulfide oxidoreductase [Rhodobacterales bacterium RIFCSPHIGHO2_02_FULL_62_130]|nr:MAG: pyridine nucleotide-disulfide oxidoreductase [Rhodobacterales bacterium RIFCSPHIGHO2_02_FULL_62_130]OHC56702.1 MAG: pyridine nucleotide-disulfide oxidoreductase [Rhodobacterales bacterium RIFCSPHIGHO2_12_FULL_62_75]HCZ00798.1 pyridine nucleotide-disulfide oxidoreductase [Rhodobacter sp.]